MLIDRLTRLCFIASAVLFSASAHSAFVVSYIPEAPNDRDEVFVRVANTDLFCFTPLSTIERVDGVVYLRLTTSDVCIPSDESFDQNYSLGYFSAGTYSFVLVLCRDAPLPIGVTCNTAIRRELFISSKSGAAVSVPAISGCSLLLMIFGIILLSTYNRIEVN